MGTKLHLVKVRINKQGYDSRRRQWGVGIPLYHAWSDDDGTFIESYVRAYTSVRDYLKSQAPDNKIQQIKLIREIMGSGLKESKDFVECTTDRLD